MQPGLRPQGEGDEDDDDLKALLLELDLVVGAMPTVVRRTRLILIYSERGELLIWKGCKIEFKRAIIISCRE